AAALADALKQFVESGSDRETVTLPRRPRPRQSRWEMWAGAAGVLLSVLGLTAGVVWRLSVAEPAATTPTAAAATATSPAVAAEFTGWIDIRVSEPNNDRRTGLLLHEPQARPLRPGDEIKIYAELNRPGYCYVLWFD